MEKTEVDVEVKEKKKRQLCYLNILFVPLGIGIILLSRMFPDAAEFYAVHIYPVFMNTISWLTGFVPFSVIEAIILFLPATLIIYMVNRYLYTPKEQRRELLLKFVGWIISWISIIFFGLVMLEGINYNRYYLADIIGLKTEKSTKYELAAMCTDLISDANSLRYRLPEDDTGVSKMFTDDAYKLAEASFEAYDKLGDKYPVLKGGRVRPKPLVCSKVMSYMEITGIFSPLTMEANIDADVTAYSLPSTMCHEISHVRGIMREDEANFLGYLACMESDDPGIRYSGTMLAMVHSMNKLYSEDYDMFLDKYAEYSDAVKRDLEAYARYWDRFEGPVAEVSNKVNDTYLKLNNQEDGVKSYGRMVDLLLAHWRENR